MRAIKVRFRQFRLQVPGEVAMSLLAKLAVLDERLHRLHVEKCDIGSIDRDTTQ